MKGSRTRLRKVLPEREREEAAVPEAIERLTNFQGSAGLQRNRLGAVGIAMASLPVRPRSVGIPVPTIPSRFTSFDHLVGAGEQRRWDFDAERPGRGQVDD
jgi:hypothetical protein